MRGYRDISVDRPPALFECRRCGAVVIDRRAHDRAVHAPAPAPATVPNRQYDDRGPAPGVYRDPKETP